MSIFSMQVSNELTIKGIPTVTHKPSDGVPDWLTPEGLHMLKNGYLTPGETPWDMYKRVANAAADRLGRPQLASVFFSLLWHGWLGAATPVLCNMGTSKGLPISCLTGDTWLITPCGGVQMQDVQVGDLILTHNGRYRPVTAKQSRMSDGDLYELAVGTRMTKTKITGNHPVLTNLGWVRVDELDPHVHFVATDNDIEYIEKPHVFNMQGYCDYETLEKDGLLYYYAAPPVNVEVTEDLAWAIGVWLAKGSRCINNEKEPNGIRITMGTQEQQHVERWLDIINKSFNVNGNWYKPECQRENFASGKLTSWISATANGKFLGNLFCTEFGRLQNTIPQWVIDLPKTHLQALMDGLLLGDGHIQPNGTWQLTLSDPKLLLGLYLVCLKLGIQVNLQMQTKIRHTMRSIKTDSVRLSVNNAVSGIQFGSLRYCPIKHLQKLDYDEEVFDITVEEDNSFSAHGMIVHNCNALHLEDSLNGLFLGVKELAHLSSKGAGVAIYMGDVRGRGASISTGGYSEGIVPWCKIYDSTTVAVSQGQNRRGATAVYLPFKHKDIEEFLRIRRPQGDENRRCMNIHHAVCITNEDMQAIKSGDPKAVELFVTILKARKETGEPYLFFSDNVNDPNILPLSYLKKGLSVKTSNLCLLEDQLVTTKEGPKQIKDLVGKVVSIWDGRQWVLNSEFKYKGHVNQLVEVTYKDGSKIRTTLNHKFPVVGRGFIEAKDLSTTMSVETHEVQHDGQVHLEAAYLKGFLTVDGILDRGHPMLMMYDSKYMCQEKILSCLKEVLVDSDVHEHCITEPSVKPYGERRVLVEGLTARRNELSEWCQGYAVQRKLPSEYLSWDKISKTEFIAGLFDASGRAIVSGNNLQYYKLESIDKSFLEQIQLLLKSLGVYSTLERIVNYGYGKYNTATCYRLIILNSSAYRLAELCNFSRLPKHERSSAKSRYKTKPTHGQISKVEIIDVKPVATYCTEVSSTHKFALADGRMTGNCSEITAYTDAYHTFVCCLSSMNLSRWHEWKDTDAVYYATWFLDAVMQEYIDKAKQMTGFENAVRFAEKSRMLGLGVLGYHTLLQQEGLPFESFGAELLNKAVFTHLADETHRASKDMSRIFGEPEWCKGTGTRHTQTLAVAPTVSNSIICGHVSAGIEPLAANCFEKRTAKGVMLYYNPIFKEVLVKYGKDTSAVWETIVAAKGSVQHLDFLTEEEKEVFLTAREINQMEIIKQAADRQKLMDKHRQGQAQSVNLFFTRDVDDTYFARVHYQAWKQGLKTLYYCRSESATQADLPTKTQMSITKLAAGEQQECTACHG